MKTNELIADPREDMRYLIGYVIEVSQMLEYNIANILALNKFVNDFNNLKRKRISTYNKTHELTQKLYDNLKTKTLGQVITKSKNNNALTEEFVHELENLCEDRNYVVHDLFKDNLYNHIIDDNPDRHIAILKELITREMFVNDRLVAIFQDKKKEVESIKESLNLQ